MHHSSISPDKQAMLLADSFFFSPEPIKAVQDLFGYGHDILFQFVSLFGDTWGVLLAIGISRWLWGRDLAYEVFLVVVASAILKEGMNLLVTVPRPSEQGIVVYQHLETPSFPSGHVMTAFAMWGMLYVRRHVHLALAAAIAIMVGLSRMYLGTHYLIDVIVGAAAGIITAWVVTKNWKQVRTWMKHVSFRWMIAGGLAVTGLVSINLILKSGIGHRWSVTGLAVGLVAGMLVDYWRSNHGAWESTRRRAHAPELDEDYVGSKASSTRTHPAFVVAVGAAGIAAGYAFSQLSCPLAIRWSSTCARHLRRRYG